MCLNQLIKKRGEEGASESGSELKEERLILQESGEVSVGSLLKRSPSNKIFLDNKATSA